MANETTGGSGITLDESYLRDPYPTLSRLRESDPVHWLPALEAWVVTRYDDIRALFVDPRVSRDRRLGKHYRAPTPGSWASRFDNESFAVHTGEEHRRWRGSVSAGFKPRAVARMEQQVRDVVEQFAAPLRGRRGVVDLCAEFTNPIPNTVISRITGIPPYPGDEDRFRRLAQDVIRRFFFYADAENIERAEAAIDELAEWVGKLADERRQEPREDLISEVIHGQEANARPLDNDEIVMLVAGLVAAGSETTTLGANGMLRLLFQHPENWQRLRSDRSLVKNAVRESLRFDFGAPTGSSARYALEDFELRGKSIRKGDMLMLSIGAAHRDPALYPDPDRFDITRDTKDLLVFGHGAHYCLGANLALQELECVLESALDFLPEDARLVEDEIEWETIGVMRRAVRLPFDFG